VIDHDFPEIQGRGSLLKESLQRNVQVGKKGHPLAINSIRTSISGLRRGESSSLVKKRTNSTLLEQVLNARRGENKKTHFMLNDGGRGPDAGEKTSLPQRGKEITRDSVR